jgi:hypothetical protein
MEEIDVEHAAIVADRDKTIRGFITERKAGAPLTNPTSIRKQLTLEYH